jgi:protocatechuate 3,4-dioxygenase alpha subunit
MNRPGGDNRARKRQPGNGNAAYRFDIRLQGDNETVFFDV